MRPRETSSPQKINIYTSSVNEHFVIIKGQSERAAIHYSNVDAVIDTLVKWKLNYEKTHSEG